MSLLQAIVLALVQGITEFLPISSSAHLVLIPLVAGWPDQGLVFDIVTHVGSLLAVMVYFRQDLATMVSDCAQGVAARDPHREGLRLAALLAVGTLPVAVGGLLLADFVGSTARTAGVIATTSIVFGVLLAVADRWGERHRELSSVGFLDAFWIGLAQAVALLPGTSRSGITLTAALFLGLSRTAGARFSFLLAIPVGLLVAAKDAVDLLGGEAAGLGFWPLVIGFGVSAISAFAVIAALLAWLERRDLLPFAAYRILLGALLLVFVV